MTNTAVHYCVRSAEVDFAENKIPGDTGWRLACVPNMVELHLTKHHPNYQRSDDHRAVTCQMCKGTAAYKNAAAAGPK